MVQPHDSVFTNATLLGNIEQALRVSFGDFLVREDPRFAEAGDGIVRIQLRGMSGVVEIKREIVHALKLRNPILMFIVTAFGHEDIDSVVC